MDGMSAATLKNRVLQTLAKEGCADLAYLAIALGARTPDRLYGVRDALLEDGLIRAVDLSWDPRRYEEPFVPYELNL